MQTELSSDAQFRDTFTVVIGLLFLLQSVVLVPQLKLVQASGVSPVPGAVRLPGGILLEGMVSITRTLETSRGRDNLELRHIDQGFRRYDVSTRIAAPVIEDASVVPSLEFTIRRKRGRLRMPQVIGAPQMSSFNREGEAVVKLQLYGDKTEAIRIGVSRINRNMVEITSLTHNWTFGMALSALPDDVLYPGLLEHAVGFEDGGVRLTMVEMLTDAGRVAAASALLDNVETGFPELSPQVERARRILRQRTASQILKELQQKMAVGQPAEAARYARLFPDSDLTPQVRGAVQTLVTDYESLQRRVDSANAALQQTIGQFEEREQKQQAREMVAAMLNDLDVHNVERLTTWELLGTGTESPAESQLALAVSGWLLGADDAVSGFAESYGLFQIQQSIKDFVLLDKTDEFARSSVSRNVRNLEGFTVDRVAAMIQHMPPPLAIPLRLAEDGRSRFDLPQNSAGIHCRGILPSGYSTTRRYPLLIAVPRQGVTLNETIDWWSRQADRFGFIVAVAEFLPRDSELYSADAAQHAAFLQLIRQLKLGLSIDDNRVFIGGHGVGGEIAMDVASSHPELFAGIISLSGLGRRHLQWAAHNSADLSWYIVLGERQGFWYERMRLLLKRLFRRVDSVRRHCNVLLIRYPSRGFESYYEELPSVFEWLNVATRNPWPKKIDSRIMRSTDLSWHWVRLHSVPERFQTLENPTSVSDSVSRYATLEASLEKNNAIRVSAPDRGVILLSPDMPGIDPARKISIRGEGTDRRIEFQPSVHDMLDEYARTGERTRLCHMKVPFGR